MEVNDLTAMRIAEAKGKALGDQSALAGREGRRPTASLAEADYEKAEQPKCEDEHDQEEKRRDGNEETLAAKCDRCSQSRGVFLRAITL
jgi:hypothetical protein